jgi:hypothetical protein
MTLACCPEIEKNCKGEIMKKLSLCLVLLSTLSFGTTSGNPYMYFLNTASPNLAATYPSTAQVLPGWGKIYSVDIYNSTSSTVIVNCSQNTQPTATAGTPNTNDIPVPTNLGYSSPVNNIVPYPFSDRCWVRSLSGTISSGLVIVTAWGY